MALNNGNRLFTLPKYFFVAGVIVLVTLSIISNVLAEVTPAPAEPEASKDGKKQFITIQCTCITEFSRNALCLGPDPQGVSTSSKNFTSTSYQYFESTNDNNNGTPVWKAFKRPFGPPSSIPGMIAASGTRSGSHSFPLMQRSSPSSGLSSPFSASPFASFSNLPLFGFQGGQ